MARDVRPTRRDYLDTRKKLERTQTGYELLEQKRQILVLELMARIEQAKSMRRDVGRAVAEAHDVLDRAIVHAGVAGLSRLGGGVAEHQLSCRTRSVMGVSVPEVSCRPEPFGLRFGLTAGCACADDVMRKFLDLLPGIAELAEVENAVLRLAREVKRTQRRAGALEKHYIPRYEKDMRYIEDALAERSREEFVVLRKVKQKRSEKE